jgi:hypothetical protein
MSVHQNFFVGPYASWLVKVGKHPEDLSETLFERLIETRILHWQTFMGELPAVRRGRARYDRYTFMPQAERSGGPRGPRFFSDCDGADLLDLTDVNQRAEIDWFAEAFREELRVLAEYFGGPPELGWGLVQWLS